MTAYGGQQVRSRDNALDTARGIAHRRYLRNKANMPVPSPHEHAVKVVGILAEVVDDSVIDRWRLNRVEIPKHERTQ